MDSLSVMLLCTYGALQKAFCQVGEADVQECTPVQHIFTGIFLHIIYCDYSGGGDTHADTLCSAAFHLGIDFGLFYCEID